MLHTAAKVFSPTRDSLVIENLPDQGTSRWVAQRKAQVVTAVNDGVLTAREACDRYQLSLEELVSWQRAVDRYGLTGLKVKKTQELRLENQRARRRTAE